MTPKQALAMHQARFCARTLRSAIKQAQKARQDATRAVGDPQRHDYKIGLWIETTTAAVERLDRELKTC